MEMTLEKAARSLRKTSGAGESCIKPRQVGENEKRTQLSPQLPAIKGSPGKTQAGLQDSATGSLQNRSFNDSSKLWQPQKKKFTTCSYDPLPPSLCLSLSLLHTHTHTITMVTWSPDRNSGAWQPVCITTDAAFCSHVIIICHLCQFSAKTAKMPIKEAIFI